MTGDVKDGVGSGETPPTDTLMEGGADITGNMFVQELWSISL